MVQSQSFSKQSLDNGRVTRRRTFPITATVPTHFEKAKSWRTKCMKCVDIFSENNLHRLSVSSQRPGCSRQHLTF